jgi:Reverse transcriptase (RNA-dependent DNA polymerase)
MFTFEETEFPTRSDFSEPPAYESLKSLPSSPTLSRSSSLEPAQVSRPICNSIEVLPLQVLAANYDPLPLDETINFNAPISYEDAMQRPDAKLWWKAFCNEIQAIIDNKTWTLIDLPPGHKVIQTKWVLRLKVDARNNPEKYKARIVVKGYCQIAGINYDETFAPVVRIESVRTIIAIAAGRNYFILHIDCKNAFLNGLSDAEIYVTQPEGFEDPHYPQKVLRLNKSLYGLKQAPRIWYLLLSEVIIGLGFLPLETDTCIYVKDNITIAVFVDDILVTGPKSSCYKFYNDLSKHFLVEDKGEATSFLGINIERRNNSISINQPGLIDRILTKFNMVNATTLKTPLEPQAYLPKASDDNKIDDFCDPEYASFYQELVGALNHLAIFTRPDLSYAVSMLAQFNSNPLKIHWKAALRVLRYLKLTRNFCITYRKGRIIIVGFSDADWGSNPIDRISMTGYVFMVNGGAVSWTSHKQTAVALSTMEAEYMALSDASRESIARGQFFIELDIFPLSTPIPIYSDNQSALEITENPKNYRKAKHIDIRYHAVRHYILEGKVEVDYIPTDNQPADILTKPLGPTKHQRCLELLNMTNMESVED